MAPRLRTSASAPASAAAPAAGSFDLPPTTRRARATASRVEVQWPAGSRRIESSRLPAASSSNMTRVRRPRQDEDRTIACACAQVPSTTTRVIFGGVASFFTNGSKALSSSSPAPAAAASSSSTYRSRGTAPSPGYSSNARGSSSAARRGGGQELSSSSSEKAVPTQISTSSRHSSISGTVEVCFFFLPSLGCCRISTFAPHRIGPSGGRESHTHTVCGRRQRSQ
mmetsp:Transcript_36133/g.108130  ORF Transcript_36133/g.108130 Transcript_36133/m.108130 type:complete len:225 (+) Transcript_36133:1781-2455(+)